jgi:hypothetical protein
MNMYGDLDPLFDPSAHAALENVAARVHRLRIRRRLTVAGTIGTLAIVTALMSGVFASGASGGAARISVAGDSTSTTPPRSPRAHAIPKVPKAKVTTTTGVSTSSSAPTSPPSTPPTANAPAPAGPGPGFSPRGIATGPTATVPVAPTSTTVPTATPARFRVTFAQPRITIQSGTSASITYAITNVGGSTGYLYVEQCNGDEQLWPAPKGLWPDTTSPSVSCGAPIEHIAVAPGQSLTFTHKLVAGHYEGTNIVPAYPGTVLFRPPELRAPAVSATGAPGVLPVTITPPATAPFTANRPTAVTAASGHEVLAPFSLTNNLTFPAQYRFTGPRTTLSATSPPPAGLGPGCVGTPAIPHRFVVYICTYTTGGSTTLALQLDLWATDTGQPVSGAGSPLAPGVYAVAWNEIQLQLTVTPAPSAAASGRLPTAA